ncbi:hypothetical protein AVEN_74069-1 [Araneus ventricosus]|uniref:Uncharacterized protein n=1 Tax=Araneus ventricosus TaxID=182803 RepID=A0A4Y2PCQ8_ARAVE|nr:hypothetical protein AVEN_74069-1 [Araneus ventricosus]
MQRPPVLPGYDLSSEMDPKSHTTIIVPSREARASLLIRLILIRELAVHPPTPMDLAEKSRGRTTIKAIQGSTQTKLTIEERKQANPGRLFLSDL